MTLQIVALVVIAVLLLFPAARMLSFLRREMHNAEPILKDGPRQMVDQILVLILVLAFLAVAVLMHIAPF